MASRSRTAANGAALANRPSAVGLELGAERVQVQRQQHLGSRQFTEGEREASTIAASTPGRASGSVTRRVANGPAPSARAESSRAGSICPSVARSATTAKGRNRIASANTIRAKLPYRSARSAGARTRERSLPRDRGARREVRRALDQPRETPPVPDREPRDRQRQEQRHEGRADAEQERRAAGGPGTAGSRSPSSAPCRLLVNQRMGMPTGISTPIATTPARLAMTGSVQRPSS